jgi:VWFA-related protein
VRPLLIAALVTIAATYFAKFPLQDQAIRVGVPLVNVYATVVDKRGAIVPNLNQTDFRIFEDKVEQKIAFFSREKTVPLSIGLVIDTSGSERDKIGVEQQAASQFFRSVLQKGDKAFVLAFDADANILADWSSDLPTLDAATRRAHIGAGGAEKRPASLISGVGSSRLYDTILVLCNKKLAPEQGRKALVILTDAHDEGSTVKLNQAVEAAQRADTIVQLLVIQDNGPNYLTYLDVAKRLAEDTGGRAIDASDLRLLQKHFDEISDQLRTEYSLGYYPANEKHDGAFRQLRLETTDKNNKALTRKGYYARVAIK